MLQDVARVWPAPAQHLTTRYNNVATCCVEMLRAFGRAFALSVKKDEFQSPRNPFSVLQGLLLQLIILRKEGAMKVFKKRVLTAGPFCIRKLKRNNYITDNSTDANI